MAYPLGPLAAAPFDAGAYILWRTCSVEAVSSSSVVRINSDERRAHQAAQSGCGCVE